MECNRDEALRAKDLAERKFTEKDYASAKKFALKAHNLSPSLEGISQLLATLSVYLASEAKVNGERDWYAVLHINSSADEEAVKQQYRKLALLLHPDKNKSVGAEGAFQLVSEAWTVLSDKSKKTLYDQKIFVEGFHQRTTQINSSAPTTNGFHQHPDSIGMKSRVQQSSSYKPPFVLQNLFPPQSQTFWTACARCSMQYEYHRMYLNKSLLCPKCKQPFLATEFHGLDHLQWQTKQQYLNAYKTPFAPSGTGHFRLQHDFSADSIANAKVQRASYSGASGANESSTGTQQAPNISRLAYKKAKRQREEARAAALRDEVLRRRLSAQNTGYDSEKNDSTVQESNTKCDGIAVAYGDYLKPRLNSRPAIFPREFTQADARAILMQKARFGILKKLEEFNLAKASKREDDEREKKKQKAKDFKANVKTSAHQGFSDVKLIDDSRSKKEEISANQEANQPLSMDVPDSDFHDFDNDRSEKSFANDQVWAIYDDDDGMPRYYAYIQNVISSKPFKVRMSFLASKSNAEFSSLNWVSSGFCKSCGEFRVGRYTIIDTINIFSHRVKWEKGFRGVIKVLPQKGEMWALYRNWRPDWNEHTPDDVVLKYEMVEVLEGYDEEEGISVAPLAKVLGFRTLFLRRTNPEHCKKISKGEMFRFSHQVPHYFLKPDEARDAPKDCIELDPASTPMELLRVITKVGDEELASETGPRHAA